MVRKSSHANDHQAHVNSSEVERNKKMLNLILRAPNVLDCFGVASNQDHTQLTVLLNFDYRSGVYFITFCDFCTDYTAPIPPQPFRFQKYTYVPCFSQSFS